MIQIDQTCHATFAATETEIDEAVLDFRSVTSPSDQDPALVSHGTHGARNVQWHAGTFRGHSCFLGDRGIHWIPRG
ncbi:hypothetical protein JG688_00008774 [Phytophthora aleatoria]|uniref:Uncharacterized protein n=1 Tax=Phytophthora aleatoria TaxID=2496075 RepID=A0A8J5IUI9_9STRA|nr:hypothetical protein JG688_00008774 [Phytophthora aleatoria]